MERLVSTRLPWCGDRAAGMDTAIHAFAHVHTHSRPVSNAFTPRFECIHALFRMCLRLVSNAFMPRFKRI